jgi:hypothetical protein
MCYPSRGASRVFSETARMGNEMRTRQECCFETRGTAGAEGIRFVKTTILSWRPTAWRDGTSAAAQRSFCCSKSHSFHASAHPATLLATRLQSVRTPKVHVFATTFSRCYEFAFVYNLPLSIRFPHVFFTSTRSFCVCRILKPGTVGKNNGQKQLFLLIILPKALLLRF